MKLNIKKNISLILALVMLVTMILAGIFTANAVGADYTVSSAAQWNELAEQNLTFEGKTVALGGNVDAAGAALKTLSAEFKGTFDGQGYTISNATVAGGGLIANTVTGNATVQNLKLANVDVTSTGVAGMIAEAVTDGTVTVTRVNADADSSVTGANITGGFFGTVKFTAESSSLTISYVQNDAAVTTGDFNAGGLIGQDNSTKGNITVDTVVTKSIVTHTGATKSAGVIGYITGVGTQNAQTVNFSDLIVGGTQKGSTAHSSMANDTAFFCAANGTINYERIYVLPGASTYMMEIAYWATWLNGCQFGSGVREKMSIAKIKEDGRITPPTEISAEEALSYIKMDDDGFLSGIIDPNCEHDWSEYDLISHPTKNDPGIEKRICSKCGLEDIKETPALGWTVEEFLADYDNCTTVNLTTAEEWTALAAAGKSFDGKTVKLCANLSGITAPLADTFGGSFLGGGFTISDSAVAGSGLIANTLTGNVTVKNLKLANVDVTSTGIAGLLAGKVESTGTVTVSKLSADENSSVSGAGNAGGLFGETKLTDATASLTMSYVLLEADVTTTVGMAGGLVGQEFSIAGIVTLESSAILCRVSGEKRSCGLLGMLNNTTTNAKGETISGTTEIHLNTVVIGGTHKNYAAFYMDYGNVTYNKFFLTGSANKNLFGAVRYDSWINGIRTNEVGVTGGSTTRDPITIQTITTRSTIEAPREIADLSVMTLDENGFITKIGRPAETPTLDLSNYDTETTFTIQNLADWELIAASGKDFAGKKILLGADIDAWNENVSTLTDTFKGSFDGQGHKLFNAKIQSGGVIANTIELSSDTTIENFAIESVSINYTAGNAGLLAGTVTGTDQNLTIRKINAVKSNVISAGFTGGLIGQLNVNSSTKSITVEIKQVSVSATVKATAANMQAGGLIGNDGSKGKDAANTVTMNISDSIVRCKVTAVSYANGLIGYYTGGNITNGGGVLADAENSAVLNLNDLILGGGTHFKVLWLKSGVVNYSNLYLLDTDGSLFGADTYGSWINGHVTKTIGAPAEEPGKDMGRGSITAQKLVTSNLQAPKKIDETAAKSIPLLDQNGFINLIAEDLQVVAVQRSVEVKDGKYSLRFLAPARLNLSTISNVQMEVVATWYDASGVLQTLIFRTDNQDCVDEYGNPTSGCTFYDFLTVYNQYGIAEDMIAASSLGAQKIAGFTIWDIPVDATNIPEGITFAATMSYTNADGQSVTSRTVSVSVDAAGNVIG